MPNLTNYHSHCTYCDGRAPMEEFVQAAIAEGFTAYGISSHAPLPFYAAHAMVKEDVPAYLQEIEALKKKYAGQIELYAGMEIDYLDDAENPANDYFQSLPLDYRIGSVHHLYDARGEVVDADTSPENFRMIVDRHYGGDIRRVVTEYYERLMRMISLGGFDMVGHADKISMNASFYRPGITQEDWYKRMIGDYFAHIAESGVMVEINTKAFDRNGLFFPNREHFGLLKELHIPLVVNSDAHRPYLINAGRKEALRALRETGIETVMELTGSQWRAVPITL